ncbi:MAG: FimV/HubP family polar landmark protein [Xanthomonadales bacterium]|nr:FimV/HubP family polar landmark protein [Xanthomonadales bacterium]
MKLLDFFTRKDDEVGTRLALAQAFADLGDMELAKSYLDEVIASGSADQVATAQTLIAELH